MTKTIRSAVGRVLVLLAIVVGIPSATAGSKDSPELTDPEGDVHYDLSYMGTKNHDYLDVLAAWFDVNTSTELVEFHVSVRSGENLTRSNAEWALSCDLQVAVSLDEQRTAVLRHFLHRSKTVLGNNDNNASLLQPDGKSDYLRLRNSFSWRLETPGYYVWQVRLRDLAGWGNNLRLMEATCIENFAPFGVGMPQLNYDTASSAIRFWLNRSAGNSGSDPLDAAVGGSLDAIEAIPAQGASGFGLVVQVLSLAPALAFVRRRPAGRPRQPGASLRAPSVALPEPQTSQPTAIGSKKESHHGGTNMKPKPTPKAGIVELATVMLAAAFVVGSFAPTAAAAQVAGGGRLGADVARLVDELALAGFVSESVAAKGREISTASSTVRHAILAELLSDLAKSSATASDFVPQAALIQASDEVRHDLRPTFGEVFSAPAPGEDAKAYVQRVSAALQLNSEDDCESSCYFAALTALGLVCARMPFWVAAACVLVVGGLLYYCLEACKKKPEGVPSSVQVEA